MSDHRTTIFVAHGPAVQKVRKIAEAARQLLTLDIVDATDDSREPIYSNAKHRIMEPAFRRPNCVLVLGISDIGNRCNGTEAEINPGDTDAVFYATNDGMRGGQPAQICLVTDSLQRLTHMPRLQPKSLLPRSRVGMLVITGNDAKQGAVNIYEGCRRYFWNLEPEGVFAFDGFHASSALTVAHAIATLSPHRELTLPW
jgi:hypothetical protein